MRVFGIIIATFILIVGALYITKPTKPILLPPEVPAVASMYQAVGSVQSSVSVFADNIAQVVQLQITPDGNYMLVGTLRGTIWIYHKVEDTFVRQVDPFFELKTSQPGFPPQEAGLTGIALGADFETSGDIFLTYSFAQEKKSFRNRVARITFAKQGKKIRGVNPVQIFEANTPGTGSHQIQQGAGVMVGGKPHFVFVLGEGFVAARALDPKQEAGKVMLIARDGSVPVGERPFADAPKVQAVGLRNPPAFAKDSTAGAFAIGDTGPNNVDRFIYGTLVNADGKNDTSVSFHWDGTETSLEKSSVDPYDNNKEMILYRWSPTETPVNILFYQNEKLPTLLNTQQYVLITLFGRTGEKVNKPGKSIVLGTLTKGSKNVLTVTPFIERVASGEGKLAHPIGLTVDPITKDVYFGDIMEGRIYKIVIQ